MVRGRKKIVHPEGHVICSRCKLAKLHCEYDVTPKSNTGFRAYCKSCWAAYTTAYYVRNKDRYKQRYQDRRGELIEYQKQWNSNNTERRTEYNERYYALLCNVLYGNASNRWAGVLSDKGLLCVASFRELLDCNKHELLERFRSLYTEGMSDMNYGEWEIDHIRPICSFDLTDMEQMKQCFHYTNMQPLWRVDNQSKGMSWNP
jgi:hypothetical protein